jgi:HAD superfamily hydrolase (TIGR01549 family)
LFAGTENVLNDLKAIGMKLGIATNGSGTTAFELMKTIGVEKLFDVFIGADEVPEGKPAPDMILIACEKVGVNPNDAIYVGDETEDVESGVLAGVKAVLFLNEEFNASKHNAFVIDSLSRIKPFKSKH